MERKYIGYTKSVKTQYGEITKIGFTLEDLDTLKAETSNGWVNLSIMTSKAGKPYTVIDAPAKPVNNDIEEEDMDIIPF